MSEVMETTQTTTHVVAEVSAKNLRDALRAGLVSASKDRFLPVLCSLRLTVERNGSVVVESTDRFRLTEATAPAHRQANASGEGWSILIDSKDAAQLVKMVPARAGHIDYATVTLTKPAAFEGDTPIATVQINYGSSMAVHGIDGQFPRVSALWPSSDALERSDGVHEFGFNPAYLADIAKLPWPSKNTSGFLAFQSPVKPAVVVHEGDSDEVSFRHLIMPRKRVS